MVDSSDTERIGTSAEEFHAILDEEELKDALILVYANKQACRASREAQSLGTSRANALKVASRDWCSSPCSRCVPASRAWRIFLMS